MAVESPHVLQTGSSRSSREVHGVDGSVLVQLSVLLAVDSGPCSLHCSCSLYVLRAWVSSPFCEGHSETFDPLMQGLRSNGRPSSPHLSMLGEGEGDAELSSDEKLTLRF